MFPINLQENYKDFGLEDSYFHIGIVKQKLYFQTNYFAEKLLCVKTLRVSLQELPVTSVSQHNTASDHYNLGHDTRREN